MRTFAVMYLQYGCQPMGRFPERVRGGQEKLSVRLQDSIELLEKLAGLRQMLQRFKAQDCIKFVVGKGEGIGAEPHQGKIYFCLFQPMAANLKHSLRYIRTDGCSDFALLEEKVCSAPCAGANVQNVALFGNGTEAVPIGKSSEIRVGLAVNIVVVRDTIPESSHFFKSPFCRVEIFYFQLQSLQSTFNSNFPCLFILRLCSGHHEDASLFL